MYIIFIMGEIFILFLVCTFRKAIRNFEVNVNVQKGAHFETNFSSL